MGFICFNFLRLLVLVLADVTGRFPLLVNAKAWLVPGCVRAATFQLRALQRRTINRDIFCVFRLLANCTQLNVSFQIHYVA